MYERTIAGEDRIYQITIPITPTLVYDLLSPADQAEYNSILREGIKVQPLNYPALNADVNRFRVPVDGYVSSVNGNIYISTSVTGAKDTILKDFQYVFPVYFWPHKHWVSSDTDTISIVRIFFS